MWFQYSHCCCRKKSSYLHLSNFSVLEIVWKWLLVLINFMMNGLKETAQNDVEKSLVTLTYIKNEVGYFFLLWSYYFGDMRFWSDSYDIYLFSRLVLPTWLTWLNKDCSRLKCFWMRHTTGQPIRTEIIHINQS